MDWRGFAKRLLLSDGRVDGAEARLLRRAIVEDGVIHRDEVDFLLELRREAAYVHPEFNRFLYAVLKRAVLQDGVIDRRKTAWLRRLIFDSYLAGPLERAFLSELARDATRVHGDFLTLLADCGVPVPPVRKVRKPTNRRRSGVRK